MLSVGGDWDIKTSPGFPLAEPTPISLVILTCDTMRPAWLCLLLVPVVLQSSSPSGISPVNWKEQCRLSAEKSSDYKLRIQGFPSSLVSEKPHGLLLRAQNKASIKSINNAHIMKNTELKESFFFQPNGPGRSSPSVVFQFLSSHIIY